MTRMIAFSFLALVGSLATAAGAGYALLHLDLAGLPSTQSLLNITPATSGVLYCADGSELARLYEENRVPVPLEEISAYVPKAVIAVEDQNFWHHWGIDLFGVTRALLADVAAGRWVQGASTITQQLARSLFLTPEVSLMRKVKEALLALRIERTYSKEEILTMYLNQVYFGDGAYGIEVGAEVFFGKKARDLTLGESALLAGLLKNPRDYSPRGHPQRALARREVVLRLMQETGAITAQEAATAAAEPLRLAPRKQRYRLAPYFVDQVRQYLEETYGNEAIYRGGFRVYTTLDPRLQEAAEAALAKGLAEREAALPRLARGIPRGMLGAESDNTPYLQGACLAIEPATGYVRAMVGGRNFYDSNFNRAVQARRQTGSAFKPFVYAAALEKGYTPASMLKDAPLTITNEYGVAWNPTNYDGGYEGPMTLRYALAHSINTPAVRVFMDVGGDQVIDVARRMGITSPIQNYPSMALGSFEVSLLEMTTAFATVANLGVRARPILVSRVEDANGRVLEQNSPQLERALAPETAYILADLLGSVVDTGTGYGARREGLVGPAAGKTGTTNDCTDAWFLGFVPGLCAGVWVGFDVKVSMGSRQSGAVVALPIWTDFVKAAHEILPPAEPPPMPPGVTRMQFCTVTGYLAGPGCPGTGEEIAPVSALASTVCPLHNPAGTGRRELPMPRWREREPSRSAGL